MEQFISDIEAYCSAAGILPQQLLKEVVGANWGTWQRWKDGKSSPTMKLVDRIRAYMSENPPHDSAHGRADRAVQGAAK